MYCENESAAANRANDSLMESNLSISLPIRFYSVRFLVKPRRCDILSKPLFRYVTINVIIVKANAFERIWKCFDFSLAHNPKRDREREIETDRLYGTVPVELTTQQLITPEIYILYVQH